MISEILQSCLQKRADYLRKNNIEAYRLLDNYESQLRLIVDIYKDNAVIHVLEYTDAEILKELETALRAEPFAVKNFFYKNRTKEDLQLPKSLPKEIVVQEYGHKFLCNLSDYLDTGLFLDHRETRKWIAEQASGKIVLNTFAYTGSFSIYAAKAGAAKTYSVDLSKTYCDWIKKNLSLNELPEDRNWVYKMDTLEFFKYAKRKNLRFDIIIIDPPSFSRNKGKSFSVQKDHPALINGALELLAHDGFILFSNNKQEFKLLDRKLTSCKIENIQARTIPADFPEAPPHECFLIRAA